MKIGVPSQHSNHERRVAIVPGVIGDLKKKIDLDVVMESGAGISAGFPDKSYRDKGAAIVDDCREVLAQSEIVAHLQFPTDLSEYRKNQIIVGLLDPLNYPERIAELANRHVTAFALELMPRITRAQGMDVLSSMASIAGYKAVILAANILDKQFPLMMTAAGTIKPARVFVVGAGVAGLQAIATAKRLGGVVRAFDVRAAVKEQVESLGAKFLELDLQSQDAEAKGGYANAMDDVFYAKQREAMREAVADSDVVITTAAVPGKKAPVLVTKGMVEGIRPGSVLVDLAAETGGNCEYTVAGETQSFGGVTVIGPTNLPSTLPLDASQMFARNMLAFLKDLINDGGITINLDDEIVRDTLVARDGKVANTRIEVALAAKQ